MQQSQSVAVLIPIYKATLSELEWQSFRQTIRVLGHYPIIVVKPNSLNADFLRAEHATVEFTSFEDDYFKSIEGYNALMTSERFYRRFDAYEYILICQLDAFVFRDTLADWCRRGYDYIGSPTLHPAEFDKLSATQAQHYAKSLSSRRFVLNGGLSLRKVSAFLRYLKIYQRFYPAWTGNEDMLFSQEATRLLPMKLFMKLPPWEEAMKFAFEKSPAASYAITRNQLPFGCHAWERYDPHFWSAFIP